MATGTGGQQELFATARYGAEVPVRASPAPAYVSEDCRREAKRAIEGAMPALRARVLAAVRLAGKLGCTDEELFAVTELSPNTCRPRRRELVQAGYVVESGETRPTVAGKRATVWIAAEHFSKTK